jgi:UDP-glucuronate decarboxylase
LFALSLNGEIATAYNVGNPSQNISIKDLAELLVNEFQENSLSIRFESRAKHDSYVPSTVLRCCPDITKIESIGWFPVVSVRNGFRRTVDSFMQKKIKMK